MQTPFLTLALAAAAAAAPALSQTAMESATFSPRLATWRGDAKGAVSFYYDDGTDSAYHFVRPALIRHHLPGTFYICSGWYGGESDPKLARWACAKDHPEIFLGDHTLNHGGVTNAAQLAEEVRTNGAVLRRLAGLPDGALLSFALPGGVAWKVTPAEQAEILAANAEVLRHDFGPNIGGDGKGQFKMNDAAKAIAALDRAEAQGSWQALLFHGVGGDWLVYPAGEHEKLLREAAARQALGRIWVGATIDVHKYATERDGASLAVSKDDAEGLDFVLRAATDPAVFDIPLTVSAAAPEGWLSARVSVNGGEPFKTPVVDGRLVWEVPPADGTAVSVRKDR